MRLTAPAVTVVYAFAAVAACASPDAARRPGAGLTDAAGQPWQPLDPSHPGGPEVAVVWGDMKGPTGLLFRAPAGFDAGVHSHTDDYHGTVVAGRPAHGSSPADAEPHGPGTTWFQPGRSAHYDRCDGPEACLLLLVFPRGPVDFLPAAAEP